MNETKIYSIKDSGGFQGITPLLDAAGLPQLLPGDKPILIKPNLVEALPPPITTPAGLIDALIAYLKQITDNEILIGEGTAALTYDTHHAFAELGYNETAEKHGVSLIDLNHEPSVYLKNEHCTRWPEMYLPEIAMECFLLSVPVLKAHSLSQVTLTMKNMMGLAPPEHFQQGGGWKKSAFHMGIQDAVADLNRYRAPDFTLLDATVGMAQAHLWGPTCDPPVGLLAASSDPVAIDAYGCELLEKNWREVAHIAQLNGELGTAEPLTVVKL